MEKFLVGASLIDTGNFISIAVTVLGLGFVIFVHELGHFAVAKFCGVRCDKFYLGFDIFGLKLFKFRWGETEYGIGALPLGGYVKMLGQDDNPARAAAEMEAAKLRQADREAGRDAGGSDWQEHDKALLDPRSYLSKTVWQRMAIISAGVIMNLIFAVVFASIAYALGVEEEPAIVGWATPGETAWRGGILPGDRIISIGDLQHPNFKQLRSKVHFGDREAGLPIVIERPGESEPVRLVVHPRLLSDEDVPRIGIVSISSLNVYPQEPTHADSSASGKILGGDQLLRAGNQKLETGFDWHSYQALHADEPIELIVSRASGKVHGDSVPQYVEESITLTPRPMLDLGIVMEIGPVLAVQHGSPAHLAGIEAGDAIIGATDSQGASVSLTSLAEPRIDPLRFDDWLRSRAGQSVKLRLVRKGTGAQEEIDVALRERAWIEHPFLVESPASAETLGVTYGVFNIVAEVRDGSPAEGKLKPGDRITAVRFVPPAEESEKEHFDQQRERAVPIPGSMRGWEFIHYAMQYRSRGTSLELTIAGSGEEKDRKVSVVPREDPTWFNPDRGIILEQLKETRKATSAVEAVRLGLNETWESTTMVVRVLRAFATRQLSPKALGGPGTILMGGKMAADSGIPKLLLFLTILSANLAVVNYLPIPVLDGGHMLFLILEKIRGKPVSEATFIRATWIGALFILTLMVWSIWRDLTRLPDWLNLW